MSQAVGVPQIELEETGTGIKIEININGLQTTESHDIPPDSPSFKAKRKNNKNPAAHSDKAYSATSKVEQMKSLFQRFRMAISPRSSTESLARSEKSDDSEPGTPRISPTSSARGSSLNVKDGGSKGHSSTHSLSGSGGSIIDLMRRKSISKKKEEKTFSINELITRLKENDGHFQECPFSIEEITYVCKEARELLLSQPVLLELSGPIHVCGDIHGQFTDLIDLFRLCGDPADSNYLFLGDYVDRGKQSLETILLLLCYKIKYPTTFFLLRGNHECSSINRAYGFYDECKRRSQVKVWKTFVEVFEVLPLSAIISDKIFCVHGGISPTLHDMNDIREIVRPLDIQGSGLESDLLWSDPSEDVELWELNDARGVSFLFGPPQVDNFLKRFNFDLIVRAHMVVEDGYEFFHDRKLVTIFSAPNYCGQYDNHGGILYVDQELKVQFKFLIPRDDVDRKSLVRPKNRELYPRRSEGGDDQ